jgi:hypothetical protein
MSHIRAMLFIYFLLTHPKKIPGSYPGPPVIRGGERGGRQEERNEGKGRMARIGKGIAFFNI